MEFRRDLLIFLAGLPLLACVAGQGPQAAPPQPFAVPSNVAPGCIALINPDPIKQKCDNRGKRYPDAPTLSNAIAADNSTGARPCDMTLAQTYLAALQQQTRTRVLSCCTVDSSNGQTKSFSGTTVDLAAFLTANPTCGVRCSGGPCENPAMCINFCDVNIPWRGQGGGDLDPPPAPQPQPIGPIIQPGGPIIQPRGPIIFPPAGP